VLAADCLHACGLPHHSEVLVLVNDTEGLTQLLWHGRLVQRGCGLCPLAPLDALAAGDVEAALPLHALDKDLPGAHSAPRLRHAGHAEELHEGLCQRAARGCPLLGVAGGLKPWHNPQHALRCLVAAGFADGLLLVRARILRTLRRLLSCHRLHRAPVHGTAELTAILSGRLKH